MPALLAQASVTRSDLNPRIMSRSNFDRPNRVRSLSILLLRRSEYHRHHHHHHHDKKKNQKKQHAVVVTDNKVVATIDSTLILKGVVNADDVVSSKVDRAILAKAFVSAYNDVHWDADHYFFISDAEIIPFLTGISSSENDSDSVGITCRLCPDDDSIMVGDGSNAMMAKTLVLDAITPVVGITCRLLSR